MVWSITPSMGASISCMVYGLGKVRIMACRDGPVGIYPASRPGPAWRPCLYYRKMSRVTPAANAWQRQE